MGFFSFMTLLLSKNMYFRYLLWPVAVKVHDLSQINTSAGTEMGKVDVEREEIVVSKLWMFKLSIINSF